MQEVVRLNPGVGSWLTNTPRGSSYNSKDGPYQTVKEGVPTGCQPGWEEQNIHGGDRNDFLEAPLFQEGHTSFHIPSGFKGTLGQGVPEPVGAAVEPWAEPRGG